MITLRSFRSTPAATAISRFDCGTGHGRLGGLGVRFVLAKACDPEAAVEVVNIDEASVRERTPRERKIGTKRPGIAGPEVSDFPALIVEFAAQLARNIDDAATAVVVADIHHVINHPHIV